MTMKMSERTKKLTNGIAGLAILAVALVAANVIIGQLRLRVDLTEEKLYRLSDGSRDILQKLETPVTLKLYFSGSSPLVPVPFKNYARRVEDLLREYELASNGRIVLEKYDPKPDSDEADWAQRYGVTGQPLDDAGNQLYMGLVAVMGEKQEALPWLDPRLENVLEYSVTRLITRVASAKKPVVGLLSSLPVMGAPRMPYRQPPPDAPKAWVAFQDLGQDKEVRSLEPTIKAIPDDLDVLVLVHPRELSQETLYAIDQYVLRGGKVLAFVDPICVSEYEISPDTQTTGGLRPSDLGPLLTGWGVTFDNTKIVADLEAMTSVRGQNGQPDQSPVWLSLRATNFDPNEPLTTHMENLMMPFAGCFEVATNTTLKVTPLIRSSKTSDLADAMTAQFGSEAVRRDFQAGMKELNLAIRLSGTFPSAFPNGRPAAEKKEGEEQTPPADDRPHLATGSAEGVVILVGDVDMLYDRFCVQALNFMGGFLGHQPINNNLDFFANVLDQVSGSAALVSIRARGKSERPFDVVVELQKAAQETYLAREKELQAQLDKSQQRLNELQAKKDETQRFILSPEQKAEIDRAQKEVQATKEELKLVRRELRADIERLGVKVKVVNILLVPLLVAAIGIVVYVRRGRPAAAR